MLSRLVFPFKIPYALLMHMAELSLVDRYLPYLRCCYRIMLVELRCGVVMASKSLLMASTAFEQRKREDNLKRLAACYPYRYQPQEDGRWCCLPDEEGGTRTLLLRSFAELHSMSLDNHLFLEDSFDTTLAVPAQVPTTNFTVDPGNAWSPCEKACPNESAFGQANRERNTYALVISDSPCRRDRLRRCHADHRPRKKYP